VVFGDRAKEVGFALIECATVFAHCVSWRVAWSAVPVGIPNRQTLGFLGIVPQMLTLAGIAQVKWTDIILRPLTYSIRAR
jgi:hypothetical protein